MESRIAIVVVLNSETKDFNQYIASQAHQVYLMVSGIPVLIKQ